MKRKRTILLCLALMVTLIAGAALPGLAAESEHKTVRVGWYSSPFNSMDQFGRRSGYAYEYQQKIAEYTGWVYEYVEGTWPELLAKVQKGEIDLMSDVSYTDARAQTMLFSSLPMGAEDYYAFISPDNTEITADDTASFNGKRVGVNQGSVQETFFMEWMAEHGVQAEIVELNGTQDDYIAMLDRGEIDVLVTLDAYGDSRTCIPICKIGSSDFFFSVSMGRPDLLSELNAAMGYIYNDNKFYNLQLYEKYISTSGANLFLTADEKEWLNGHGAIRVGYLDNNLAYCSVDTETWELTGALKNYLEYASTCLENAVIQFDSRAFSSVDAALAALDTGEIDCVFPVNFSSYDGESRFVMMTAPVMIADMYVAVRSADQKRFSLEGEGITAALQTGNLNDEHFLMDTFPSWQIVFCEDMETCFQTVESGEADCVLLSSYSINSFAESCKEHGLTTLSTGEEISFSFAVRRMERNLLSILNKTIAIVPTSVVHSALSYYSTVDLKVTVTDFIRDNSLTVLLCVVLVGLIIFSLLLLDMKAGKKANDTSKLISTVEYDDVTHLYNKNFFYEYANRIYQNHPEKRVDAIALNIDQFHSINDVDGRAFGDEVLRVLGEEISAFLNQMDGIGSRIEADYFAILCAPQPDYQTLLDRLQGKVSRMLTRNTRIRLRMGVKPWQEGMDPVQLVDRARVACGMIRGTDKHLLVYDEELQVRENLNQRLLIDMGRAMEEREFKVFFQPKYDIQSDPPRLVSAEALIRWQHPELGMVAPIDFIPLFEKNGQIFEIDKYVWTETAREIAKWRDQYGVIIPVSVNLSAADLLEESLEPTLERLLKENGLDHQTLKLEVTESAYAHDNEKISQMINRLREHGYIIEIDDFGNGNSSLNVLSSMSIDVLKMDRAFIQSIEHNEKAVRLVELILELAKNLKIPVEAEGVETESQMHLLRDIGCALVQGYYFSQPLPPEDFEKLIIAEKQKK